MKTQGIFILLSLAIFGIVHCGRNGRKKCKNDSLWVGYELLEIPFNCETIPKFMCMDHEARKSQLGADFTDVAVACPKRCNLPQLGEENDSSWVDTLYAKSFTCKTLDEFLCLEYPRLPGRDFTDAALACPKKCNHLLMNNLCQLPNNPYNIWNTH